MTDTATEGRKLAAWTNKPFTSHRKRHYTVEHRLVLDYYPDVGADIRHEIRCERRDLDEWTLAEKWECRAHGIDHITTTTGKGLP